MEPGYRRVSPTEKPSRPTDQLFPRIFARSPETYLGTNGHFKFTTPEFSKGDSAANLIESPECWHNCDFETAIAATGYGRYNVMIMAAALLPVVSGNFTSTSMSLILPSAECDLGLTSFHKGLLNACTYIGMIISAPFWGFLSDTLGRQRLIAITCLLDAFFNGTAAIAQNFPLLLTAKIFAGLIASGPYAILVTYLAESHSSAHRSSIIQWQGIFLATGMTLLPILAWSIIPQPWSLTLFDGRLHLPAWRIFLLVCTVPAVLSSICFFFRRESPKFLMTRGRYEEAMLVFQHIYSINQRMPASTFPVQSLLEEKKVPANEEERSFISSGWEQMKPLFRRPHCTNAILIFLMQSCTVFGLNTIRLWLPQLFSTILNNSHLAANASTICDLLVVPPREVHRDCSTFTVNHQVYIRVIIIGTVTGFSCFISGHVIKLSGKKWLIVGCSMMAAAVCFGMYWATSADLLLVLSSLYISFAAVNNTGTLNVVVDLFPTTLRTMAVSLTLMTGRLAGIVGNLIFPLLLDWNCTVPIFLWSAIAAGTGFIMLTLPKTNRKALE